MHYDLVLKNAEVVYPGQFVKRGHVAVLGEKIAALLCPSEQVRGKRVIDCTGKWVFPGVIDPHTHIGFGDGENDWGTETMTAALGGVTGLLSFWRSEDLSTSTNAWISAANTRSYVDFGLHFGLTSLQHVLTLEKLSKRFGVKSFKVYLMYKGKTGQAKGFTEVDDALLYSALQVGARIKGAVVSVHCENTEVIPVFREPLVAAGRDDLCAWDEQSPDFLETENVFRVLYFGEKAGCAVNIVHMSASESLDLVRRFQNARRPPIYVETCAHYLSLTKDSPLGTIGKVNPPLRSQKDVDKLWEGISTGDIQTVGSDHVPRTVATKSGSIWQASAGFPGIAQVLPILLEEGYFKRGIPIEKLSATVSSNVAEVYSLRNKGFISPGFDADFVVVDPTGSRTINSADYPSYSDYSPYEGLCFRGAVLFTILRGNILVENGSLKSVDSGFGEYLNRSS